MFINKKIVFTFILSFLVSSVFLYAEKKSKMEDGKFYINKAITDKKAGGVISGPYEDLDQAVAGWIATNQREDSFYCISSDNTVIATKPSKQIPEVYDQILDEFVMNPEAACSKYDVTLTKAARKRIDSLRAKMGMEPSVVPAAPVEPVPEVVPEPVPEVLPEVIPEPVAEAVPPVEPAVTAPVVPEAEEKAEEPVAETPVPAAKETAETPVTEPVAPAEKTDEEKQAEENARLEAEKLEAERLAAEAAAAELAAIEKLAQEEAIKKALETVSITPTVSRYQKEYLQDYMKDDLAELPDDYETAETPLIPNPDEKDSNGQTLLMKAAKAGNEWQIKLLIKSDADLNIKDKDGWTALMYAVRYQESVGVVNLLINGGADVKAKNNYDSSALLIAACYNNNPEILKKLLSYYSISEKDVLKAFTQLLSSTLITEYVQIAKINIFLEKSLQLNTFYEGKTPLMYAAQYGNSTKVIKLLLDNGCITTVRSTEGKTAFEYATKNTKLKHDDNYWALNLK